MADEFHTGVCSGSWWNMEAAAEQKPTALASEDLPSSAPLLFHDLHQAQPGFLLHNSQADGFSQHPPSPSVRWSHNLETGDARIPSDFHAMLQEEHHPMTSKPYTLLQSPSFCESPTGLFRDLSPAFLVDQPHPDTGGEGTASSTFFEGVIDHIGNNSLPAEVDHQHLQWCKLQQPHVNLGASQFWSSAIREEGERFYASLVNAQYSHQTIAKTNTTVKNQGPGDSVSATPTRKSTPEPSLKKARIETPSPLPPFKVRKEKLGDRITALQQLVSPFGKTDTASVLYEAIEYIKFLHEQINVLSTPYMKNSNPLQQQQNTQNTEKMKDGEGVKKDLRTRGLCLVPISTTFAVANEPSDFWNPTFGGTYR